MTQNHNTANDCRPDIDGLRAIAVLSVIVFHARDVALPGGFVGVDIFFAISGFLISKHIAAEVLKGRFSFAEFYRRRIRRIVPMMMTVVGATLLASLVVMTPEDARAVAKSAIWSIASMANIHFWLDLDTGYFANSSAEIPLLHLWSLGVEEQFYFIWPVILLVGIRKLRITGTLVLATLLAGLSFWLASHIFSNDPSFAYYMLPTRMGELLVGAIVGIATTASPRRMPTIIAHLAAWSGILLIGGSFFFIDRFDPFPGWLALPSTLGAALLFLAGEQRPNPIPGLASRPMVFVGKISYSAYLWHWPFFALFRYSYGEPSTTACIAIIALTLLLAWLSFEWIEKPTRKSTATFAVVTRRQFATPALILIVASLLVVQYAERISQPLASSDYLKQLQLVRESTRPAHTFNWVCQRKRMTPADVADPRCVLGAPGEAPVRAILWGDSNASHYVPMIREITAHAGVRFRNFAVYSCPPLFSDPAAYVDARRLKDCQESTGLIRQELQKYPVIIISSAWSTYLNRSPDFLDKVEEVVRTLNQQGKSVILLGKAPILSDYDPRCKEKALRVPHKSCNDDAQPLSNEVIQVNQRLKALAERTANTYYFDGNRYLCPEGKCHLQTRDGIPLFIDADHLTVSGSAELGKTVLAAEGIPSAFAVLQAKH